MILFRFALFFLLSVPLLGEEVAQQTIAEVVASSPQLTKLHEGLVAAEVQQLLEGQGPFTLFAPTDEAFAQLPPTQLQELFSEENRDQLRDFLLRHIAPGDIELVAGQERMIKSLTGDQLHVIGLGSSGTVNEVPITKANLPAANGLVQITSAALLDKEAASG